MILLEIPDAHGTTFKVLLIASEIIIPIIVFIGAYIFFKPVFEKQKNAMNDETVDGEDESKEP